MSRDKLHRDSLPEIIETVDELDEVMTRPGAKLIEWIQTIESPLLVLGAGGKMGPTLSVLARRAAEVAGRDLDVIAVSRFSETRLRDGLEARGVRTVSANLLERDALRKLPDSSHIVYLVGLKFGTTDDPSRTWVTNTLIPAAVCERFPGARIAALSTGNVYALTPAASRGSVETDDLAPVGEYASAALGRERTFEFFSKQNGTPVTLVRLNYAVDLRYGVLVDIALKVHSGTPVDVTMGHLNCIWQGDANDCILRSMALASTPPAALNLTGAAVLSVREIAHRFGDLLNRVPQITGQEADTALLSNATRACEALGPPPTSIETVMRWTANWIKRGGRLLGKPTHFEARNGKF